MRVGCDGAAGQPTVTVPVHERVERADVGDGARVSKVTVFDSPGAIAPVSNMPAAVAVCCWSSLLVHVTCHRRRRDVSGGELEVLDVDRDGHRRLARDSGSGRGRRPGRSGGRGHRHRRCRCNRRCSAARAVVVATTRGGHHDDGQCGKGGADDHTPCSARPPFWIEVSVSAGGLERLAHRLDLRALPHGASSGARSMTVARPLARPPLVRRRPRSQSMAVGLVAEPAGGAGDRRRQQRLGRRGRTLAAPYVRRLAVTARRGRAGW